jgi:hypothetical protein
MRRISLITIPYIKLNPRKLSTETSYLNFLPKSVFKNNRYQSPWITHSKASNFADLLRWKLFECDDPPDILKRLQKCRVNSKCDVSRTNDLSRSNITWIGHSTCLIQTDGVYILTDPVWSHRVSPVPFAGPTRVVPPTIQVIYNSTIHDETNSPGNIS